MLIIAENIGKVYNSGAEEIHALKGVSISIEEGEYVAITGRSGSGKSTLMHILGCLDTPTYGSYQFRGRDVSKLNDIELSKIRNKEIGFVFQFFNLLPRISALHQVELPLIYAGVLKDERKKRALLALEKVELLDRISHSSQELSGGECQRVVIARAIVTSPKLILADEPTGNLDSKTGEEIIRLFEKLNYAGETIIIVTHESSIANRANRVITLKDGAIEKCGV